MSLTVTALLLNWPTWLPFLVVFKNPLQPWNSPAECRCECASYKAWGSLPSWRQHLGVCTAAHREQIVGLKLLEDVFHPGKCMLITERTVCFPSGCGGGTYIYSAFKTSVWCVPKWMLMLSLRSKAFQCKTEEQNDSQGQTKYYGL